MKPSSAFFLIAVSWVPGALGADSVVTLNAKAVVEMAAAQSGIDFLFANVDKCTRHGDLVKDNLLTPLHADLQDFQAKLSGTYGNFVASKKACIPPSRDELAAATAAATAVQAEIQVKLDQSKAPQDELMGMTGDEAMNMALSADPSYPDCPAEDPKDPASTAELKAYYTLKDHFAALQAVMGSLLTVTDLLSRGAGVPVCRKSP